MFLESFRHLIEINALKKQNDLNYGKIQSEQKRISDLEERRKKTVSLIESLTQELSDLKLNEKLNQINHLDDDLKKLNSKIDSITNEREEKALTSEMLINKSSLFSLENAYFIALEESEKISEKINDCNTFLKGSHETLAEIKIEVSLNIKEEQKEIDQRNLRIEALLNECHPLAKTYYLECLKKFAPKDPISFLVDKKCSACFIQVDSELRNSLEEGRNLEWCPNCSRLLIPTTAKIF